MSQKRKELEMATTEQLTELGDVLTAGTELDRNRPPSPSQARLVVRFDVETATIYRHTEKRRSNKPLKSAVLLRYVEQPSRTPTGGRFIARRLRVRTNDGRFWVGQMRNGTDIVKLRPEPKAKDNV
jgi:hypothetical protein